jgi:hypothetical protein
MTGNMPYVPFPCRKCARFSGHYITPTRRICCTAFPTGIPDAIFFETEDHFQPFPGDHGLGFQLLFQESYPGDTDMARSFKLYEIQRQLALTPEDARIVVSLPPDCMTMTVVITDEFGGKWTIPASVPDDPSTRPTATLLQPAEGLYHLSVPSFGYLLDFQHNAQTETVLILVWAAKDFIQATRERYTYTDPERNSPNAKTDEP